MAWRLYLIPMTGTGSSHLDPRRPAYVVEAGLAWAAMDYGAVAQALVAADTDAVQDAALTAHGDVTGIPTTLDQAVGAAANTIRTRLEAAGIPADWVQGSDTLRGVVRGVAGTFQFAQRYTGLFAGAALPVVGVGALDTRWNQLSATDRQRFLDTAASFGYDLAWVTNTTQLRALLKWLADAWGSRPFLLGGLTF